MMKFQLDDLSLNYHVIGEGVPVLMLHGRPTDHHAMIAAFEPIFEQHTGFQRVYVDLPGMGDTTGGSWINGNDDVLDVLVTFIDTLFADQQFLVAGFSYGGYLTHGLLHHKFSQIEGVLLLVPAMGDAKTRTLPPHRIFGNETHLFREQYPEPLADLAASITVVHEAAVIARQGEILDGVQKADQVMQKRIGENYTFTFPVEQLPATYEKPMLILTGKHDCVTGYESAGEWQTQFPRATYVALDRAGHGLHMEQPALFNLLVHDWLERVAESMAVK